jgi:hypothetical protein
MRWPNKELAAQLCTIVLVLVTTAPSYAAEAWIRHVDSCLIRTKGVQSKPANRASAHAPSPAEFEQLRGMTANTTASTATPGDTFC